MNKKKNLWHLLNLSLIEESREKSPSLQMTHILLFRYQGILFSSFMPHYETSQISGTYFIGKKLDIDEQNDNDRFIMNESWT